ncbi:TIGR03086 family metal-binding protein [Streptomyces sp. JNUCC 64]
MSDLHPAPGSEPASDAEPATGSGSGSEPAPEAPAVPEAAVPDADRGSHAAPGSGPAPLPGSARPAPPLPGAVPAGPPLGALLASAGRQAVALVRALPDGRPGAPGGSGEPGRSKEPGTLDAPTPCADYDVRELVNHLFHVVTQFRELALKKPSDFSATPDRVAVGPDWREGFAGAVTELVRAWSLPGAEEGTTGAMDLPARTVGSMVLLDLAVHGWDLARAVGAPFDPDPDGAGVVRVLEGAVAGMAPTARAMGMFGEPVDPPEGAGPFERLLAVTGRDPGWTPPAPGTA